MRARAVDNQVPLFQLEGVRILGRLPIVEVLAVEQRVEPFFIRLWP